MTGTPLNSVQLIPVAVLNRVWCQLGSSEGTPLVASIRGLYPRRRTLSGHRQAALDVLESRHFHEHAEPGLIAWMRSAAADTFEVEALVVSARTRPFEHRCMIPPTRRLRRFAVATWRYHETTLVGRIEASLAAEVRADRRSQLAAGEFGD